MSNIHKWVGRQFVSSTTKTREFMAFCRDFKSFVKENLPPGAELVKYNSGHFYVSGFIRRGNNYVYFSTPDVRFSHWPCQILVRRAANDEDFTGGVNYYANCDNFRFIIDELLGQWV